jgi:hypothetical protein
MKMHFLNLVFLLHVIPFLQRIVTKFSLTAIMLVRNFFLNKQQDALIIQIYSVIKLYMFRISSLSIIRSFLLYIRYW